MSADERLRLALIAWVQAHTILRREEAGLTFVGFQGNRWTGLVSDSEAVEELMAVVTATDRS